MAVVISNRKWVVLQARVLARKQKRLVRKRNRHVRALPIPTSKQHIGLTQPAVAVPHQGGAVTPYGAQKSSGAATGAGTPGGGAQQSSYAAGAAGASNGATAAQAPTRQGAPVAAGGAGSSAAGGTGGAASPSAAGAAMLGAAQKQAAAGGRRWTDLLLSLAFDLVIQENYE